MSSGRYPKREKPRATNPQILRVAREVSANLKRRSVPHVLIGGLAVSAYGYDRATHDADFLVSGEAQEEIAGDTLGGEVRGKTITVHGVDVDLLFPKENQDFLEDVFVGARKICGIPVVPIEVLIYLKLIAARARDQGDIVELVKRGKVKINRVVTYLREHRPDLIEDFKALVVQAENEPE